MVTLYQLMLDKGNGRKVSIFEPSEYRTVADCTMKEINPLLKEGAQLYVEENEIPDEFYNAVKLDAIKFAKEYGRK
jgi:hypothetical protein